MKTVALPVLFSACFVAVLVIRWSIELQRNISAPLTIQTLDTPKEVVTKADTENAGAIKILIFGDTKAHEKYRWNTASLECYAGLQDYEVQWLFPTNKCKKKLDRIFFLKLCSVHEHMLTSTATEWFLVLDADNFVVNPNHRIESYIDYSKDVIHYLRFHNNEVAAGNYIVRNTAWGRNYIKEWFGYHDQSKFSGMNEDNGALHFHLLHRLAPKTTNGWKECIHIGKHGNYSNYPEFVTCFHHVVKQTGCVGMDWPHIRIRSIGTGWTIDDWAQNYRWSNSSFMHHAVKGDGNALHHTQFVCDDSFQNSPVMDLRVNQYEYDGIIDYQKQVLRRRFHPSSWDDSSCIERDQGKLD